MMSISVQCTQEIPPYLLERPQPLTATAHNPAAQRGVDRLFRNVGTFPELLAEDMSKLRMEVPRQRKEDGTLEQMVAPLLSLDVTRCQGASSNVSNKADNRSGDRTMHTVGVGVFTGQKKWQGVLKSVFGFPPYSSSKTSMSCPLCWFQMPATNSPSLVGGVLMSDVALQSHVCEFCQAVFPGDTTTRGEFLRHLYTHVT